MHTAIRPDPYSNRICSLVAILGLRARTICSVALLCNNRNGLHQAQQQRHRHSRIYIIWKLLQRALDLGLDRVGMKQTNTPTHLTIILSIPVGFEVGQ